MTRFDFIKYDKPTQEKQAKLKERCEQLAEAIEQLPAVRARSLALTKLEECYSWVGKALRDGQRAAEADGYSEDQPERSES